MTAVNGVSLPELPTESLTLGNGFRVRLIPLPHLQSATVSFFVRVGSRYETAQSNGLSHFLEHMLYRGTETHPAAHELNLAIERLGGTLDAATHVDFTSYDLTLPSETIANGTELLAEVLRQPLLTELSIEKQIIREEILEELNEDGEQIDIDNVSRQLLYPDHPLGFSIAGPIENLDRFESVDLRRHHTRHYAARNSVICVAGAFDPRELSATIRSHFDDMPSGTSIEPNGAPRDAPSMRFSYVHEHGSQTDVRVSFHTPGVTSPEAPTLLLLGRVLDDGLSTRVHQTICEDRGLAYEAFAGNDAFEDCGVFEFGASVEHKKAPVLVQTVFELIDELRRHPPTKDEVEKAKRRYLWDLRMVRDDPEDTAHFVGTSALFGLPERIETMAEQVGRVAPGDIQQAVQRYLDPENAYLTCVGVLDDGLLSDVRTLAGA
ncbi:MAG: insulinase family protein [Deltaproteobacteria bacterium]|nr:insulinase family protein [Deltaproteobacteria bacterium]MBW2687267.1 insulinase family protein [Deltaproteobacteria bacterium]